MPLTQDPEQHSSGSKQKEPSGWQGSWQTPSKQLPEQHSRPLMHIPPSGVHALAQSPPAQVPEQQSGPVMHGAPSGEHCVQSTPQSCSASATQNASQADWQQNGSTPHTWTTHAPH
jgi:hypothetical protein